MPRLCVVALVGTFFVSALARGESARTITGQDGGRMVLVPAGSFMMGSGEANPDETPPHSCDLPAFYIDVNEVTNAQYARYIKATGAVPPPDWEAPDKPKGSPDWPVSNVTWVDAMHYAVWAGKRLPTEAEWEKAARGTDGRRFPWGDRTPAEGEELARLDGAKFRPVGSYPKSVSPFGCQDMAGNAWEWTADWYDVYPGTNARSVHFGRQYKVMKGGGTEYFYSLNENTGRCALRGRILPYAGEDYLGFRCAKDADAGKPAYDPAKLLAEAENQLKLAMPKPVQLSYETQYESYVKAGAFPLDVVGEPRQAGMVRIGVPFPQGLVKDIARVQVIGPDGKPRATQQKMLTPWKDGSARWVLLDFPAEANESCSVRFNGDPAAKPAKELQVRTADDQITVDTGRATFTFSRKALLAQVKVGQQAVVGGMAIDLNMDLGKLHPLPAERMEVQDKGPLHAGVRMTGWFADASDKKSPIQYDLLVHMLAGSTRANLLLTLTHLQPRTGKIEERTPMARIIDASVRLTLPSPSDQVAMATDLGVLTGPIGAKCELLQPDAAGFTIRRDGQEIGKGTRSPGWMALKMPVGWLSIGVRHFWQNYAKALTATPGEAVVRLWAGTEPVEFEATMAKTHELVIEFSPQAPAEQRHVELEPLRAGIQPAWACGTQALGGPMIPRCPEMVAHLPYWMLAREGGMQQWMRSMCYSWRDFGDTRHGGETKGANAFHNLEYDVPFNFLLQYLATGHTWYLDAAEIQCRHQADIDTDHVTGQPYKHERFHTTWYADIAHMFLRGLVVHYWVTGDERSLETARMIGDHIAPQAEKFQSFGNERQIGWGLYALSGIYEATLDEKYLNAATKLCDTLISGMSRHGKFSIRWDNRMSLMNGMAMNGMMSVQELSGDERLAEGLLRLSRRTLGFYPEYAMRTLHGYAWALTRTNDPRYLDVLDKTWKSTLEFLMSRGSDATAEEVHAWRFPWFAVKYNLFPLFDKIPDRLPDYATWKGQLLPADQAEMFVRTADAAAAVLVVLDGIADGRAELFDPSGKLLQTAEFKAVNNRLYQPAAFNVPARSTCRMRLTGYRSYGWELHHDANSSITLFDPKADQINVLCPKAFCYLKPVPVEMAEGKPKVSGVRILFEAVGEGVHSVTLHDPDGNVVATAQKYLPLEDKGRYEVELKLPIADQRLDGWSIEAHQAKVLQIQGFLPYWSSSRAELFDPETAARK